MITLWKIVLLLLLLINWGNVLAHGRVLAESVPVMTREFLLGLRSNAVPVDHPWNIPV